MLTRFLADLYFADLDLSMISFLSNNISSTFFLDTILLVFMSAL